MSRKIETVIIGGGQAGLATSYYLTQHHQEHIVLEQAAKAGNAWRNDRWDSFTLLTPNWSFQLPGAEYREDAPDSFMPKDEVVARLEHYVDNFKLPVHFGAQVTSIEPDRNGQDFLVKTEQSDFESHNVVVATGLFQQEKIPASSADLSPWIFQLHSGKYRNPRALPQGAVLVIGSAQSGCQIAEELYQGGRKVYLSTGSTGRVPRRYRGKDIYDWMLRIGSLDRTVDMLPSPGAKFAGNPHVSGRDGGRTLNLHQFARDGVQLLGRFQGAADEKIWFSRDLKENLAKVDQFEADLVKNIDRFVEQQGLNAPEEKLPDLRDGYTAEEITELDLHQAGITTIIWAVGYQFDFSLVKLPIRDGDGFPLQQRGVTAYPGLFFVGLPWLYKYKSGHLLGVGEDAEYIASRIAERA